VSELNSKFDLSGYRVTRW